MNKTSANQITDKKPIRTVFLFIKQGGHLWKNMNVYSFVKKYSERQERLKFRRKNILLFVEKCGWNLQDKINLSCA